MGHGDYTRSRHRFNINQINNNFNSLHYCKFCSYHSRSTSFAEKSKKKVTIKFHEDDFAKVAYYGSMEA